MKHLLPILLILCGCATERPTLRSVNVPPLPIPVQGSKFDVQSSAASASAVLPPAKEATVTIRWTPGSANMAAHINPISSRLEESADRKTWFTTTNFALPASPVVSLPANQTNLFYRVCDFYWPPL